MQPDPTPTNLTSAQTRVLDLIRAEPGTFLRNNGNDQRTADRLVAMGLAEKRVPRVCRYWPVEVA